MTSNKSITNRYTPKAKPAKAITLRQWQAACLTQQLASIKSGARQAAIGAGVGSGKSILALSLLVQGGFDLAVVVVPRGGIRASWAADARMLDLSVVDVRTAEDVLTPDLPHVFTLTVPMLQQPGVLETLSEIAQGLRVLVVADESHHLHGGNDADIEANSWGASVLELMSHAAYTIGLTGTPSREDGMPVLAMKYKQLGADLYKPAPDFIYSYAQSVADGITCPVVSRFVGGDVTVVDTTGRALNLSFNDGDYSEQLGEEDSVLMSRRLRAAAVDSLDWQRGALNAGRDQLARLRADGRPWAGMVTCLTIEQAHNVAAFLRQQGERVMVLVDGADTQKGVDQFNRNASFTWVVACTSIGEGVSIPRLRVGVYLTTYTTQGFYAQMAGRLCRALPGLPPVAQVSFMFLPKDPRLVKHAMSSNELVLEAIKWRRPETSDAIEGETTAVEASAAEVAQRMTDRMHAEAELANAGAAEAGGCDITPEMIEALEAELAQDAAALTITPSDYWTVVSAQATLEGGSLNDVAFCEDTWREVRAQLVDRIGAFLSAHLTGAGIAALVEVREQALRGVPIKDVLKSVQGVEAGIRASLFQRTAHIEYSHWASGEVEGWDDVRAKRKGEWTFELAHAEALKYETRRAFRLGSRKAYDWGKRNKCLDELCSHMKDVRITWTFELAHAEALKYETRRAFALGSPKAYQWGHRNKCLDELCSHMKDSKQVISEAARKAHATRTPEQRSETVRKAAASRTPEQRSEAVRKANASRTPEQRSEAVRKANATRRAKKQQQARTENFL